MALADTLFVSPKPRSAQAIGRHAETKNRDRLGGTRFGSTEASNQNQGIGGVGGTGLRRGCSVGTLCSVEPRATP